MCIKNSLLQLMKIMKSWGLTVIQKHINIDFDYLYCLDYTSKDKTLEEFLKSVGATIRLN